MFKLSKRLFSTLKFKRGDFARLVDSDITHFESIVGKENVKTTELDLYNTDWMKSFKGNSTCVLLPQTAQQVSAILKHCFHRYLAVVPQSGNTGLVGASVPVFDEIILSTSKLRNNFNLDLSSGILECDSGFILEELESRLAPQGYIMPIDLGAKGSCLIGGNVATAAGGIRFIRYGSMHSNVLGLQVALADQNGTLLELGTGLRKDNSGLHSHHLFVGSEGQLGIITGIKMLVAPKPTSICSMWLGTDSFEKCQKILREAKTKLGEVLSAFEFLDAETLRCLKENENLDKPLETASKYNLLIETSGSNPVHDMEKVDGFLSYCLENELAKDGILAKNQTEASYLWKLRETATLALMHDGYVYKNDVSLPLKYYYELTDVVRERLGDKAIRVINYGHLGDGNAHLNITTKKFSQEVYDLLYPFIYKWVTEKGGSISAEHGIGQLKKPYIHLGKHEKELSLNKELKKIFDPKGILNPYKMIDL
uniref:D-2-hydroxyglutarate dehydrogenase, mitochondrial n=1 Tax=Acrobeloides nanus TaxID=290746 RepID=A0A914DCM2_9BILA